MNRPLKRSAHATGGGSVLRRQGTLSGDPTSLETKIQAVVIFMALFTAPFLAALLLDLIVSDVDLHGHLLIRRQILHGVLKTHCPRPDAGDGDRFPRVLEALQHFRGVRGIQALRDAKFPFLGEVRVLVQLFIKLLALREAGRPDRG